MSAASADFIPPMPTPAAREPSGIAGLLRARRDVLSIFPRDAYRRLYDAAMAALPEKAACRLVVEALALAHERGCEADLAAFIAAQLDAGLLPDLLELSARFTPAPQALPQVTVSLTPLSAYDALTAAPVEGVSA